MLTGKQKVTLIGQGRESLNLIAAEAAFHFVLKSTGRIYKNAESRQCYCTPLDNFGNKQPHKRGAARYFTHMHFVAEV